MQIIPPLPPCAPDLGPTLLTPEAHLPKARFRPPHKSIGEAKRNYGIEVVAAGPAACELCEKLGGYPFAGFFALDCGERTTLCDLCLLDMAPELGILLGANAFLRKVGAVPSLEARQVMAPEIARFAHLYDTLLTRRFGPAGAASPLLEHLARLGRAELGQPPRTH